MSNRLLEEELIEKEIIEKCGLSPKTAKLLKDMGEETYKEIATEVIFLAEPIIVAKTAEIVLKEVGEAIEKEHGIAVSVEYPHDAKYTVSKEFIEALKKGERVQPLGDTAKKRYRHILKKMKNGGQDGDK